MCSVCARFEQGAADGRVPVPSGAIAQVVERLHGMEKAEGSSPSSSTLSEPSDERRRLGFAFGGLVAAEGTFTTSRLRPDRADGSRRTRFLFALTMAARDRPLVLALRDYLCVGSLTDRPRRSERWQPTVTLTVSGRRSHHAATIPFAEAYLLPSAKRAQFERWRDQLAAYESAFPSRYGKGRSTCRLEGCDRPVRGRGLCRAHYYRATGW
jgi:LAGLIDADG endonuclease